MKPTHHSINYIEFSVTDILKAKIFFKDAFDWSFTDYAPTYAGIKMMEGEGEMGGLNEVDNVVAGGPLIVLYSDNLESSFEKVKSAGGQITKEVFEFPGGRRFEFADPFGNSLAVWTEL